MTQPSVTPPTPKIVSLPVDKAIADRIAAAQQARRMSAQLRADKQTSFRGAVGRTTR